MPGSRLDLQLACSHSSLPGSKQFNLWVDHTLIALDRSDHYLTIRVVDSEEMQSLNREYRQQDKLTNVLSFPFNPIEGIENLLLGDVVLCAPIIEQEAVEQGMLAHAHWAHMVIHGILHLCGYDHVAEKEAGEMEALEVSLLAELGLPDPYHGDER